MGSSFGQMEVYSRDIGSMAKLVELECSGQQQRKCSRVSGSKTRQLTYAYSDKIMAKKLAIKSTMI